MVLESPLYMQANAYTAKQDRSVLALLAGEGVVTQGALAVSVRSEGANMSVDVAAGKAIVVGDDQSGQGSYLCNSTSKVNLPVGAAPGSNSRIDLVILRVRDGDVTGGAANDFVLEVVPGAVAVAPVPAALPASAIALGHVLVAAGTLSVTASMLTDVRDVAPRTAIFDPSSPTVSPSEYPSGLTFGQVAAGGGWPVTGTVTTHKRQGTRTWQELVQADQLVPAVARYFRQGYYGTNGPNAWGPWQRVDWRAHTQTIDLPSLPANSVTAVDIATPTGTLPSAVDRVLYGAGLGDYGLVVQGVNVVAADTIRLRVMNVTGAAIDPASASFQFLIFGRYI